MFLTLNYVHAVPPTCSGKNCDYEHSRTQIYLLWWIPSKNGHHWDQNFIERFALDLAPLTVEVIHDGARLWMMRLALLLRGLLTLLLEMN